MSLFLERMEKGFFRNFGVWTTDKICPAALIQMTLPGASVVSNCRQHNKLKSLPFFWTFGQKRHIFMFQVSKLATKRSSDEKRTLLMIIWFDFLFWTEALKIYNERLFQSSQSNRSNHFPADKRLLLKGMALWKIVNPRLLVYRLGWCPS